MDREEKLVYKYLLDQGYEEIQYEPNRQGNNSNVPPDFSIKGNIGIEVRRLNQHYDNGTTSKPLEDVEYSLSDGIRNLLKSYNKHELNRSAFVNISFSRPIRYSKPLIKELKKQLDEHLSNLHQHKEFKIRNLSVKLLPSSSKLDDVFHIGVQVDEDSGGLLVSNIYDNLKIVISDKNDKVRPEFEKYDTWWLILVDYISYGMTKNDLEQLNMLPSFDHCFDRILLLPPIYGTHTNEIKL